MVTSDDHSLLSVRILSSWDFQNLLLNLMFSVIFYPLIPHPALGYKSPLVHAVFGIELISMLRSLLPYFNSFWIKSFYHFNYWVGLVVFPHYGNLCLSTIYIYIYLEDLKLKKWKSHKHKHTHTQYINLKSTYLFASGKADFLLYLGFLKTLNAYKLCYMVLISVVKLEV